MYNFLAALPALLGLVGFVVFRMLQNLQRGDAITPKIIEKLRAQNPERLADHENLTPKQLYQLLLGDQNLRGEVDRQDFELLRQTLRQQHVQAVLVYSICAFLFVVGTSLFVYQINRPVPAKLSGVTLESMAPAANGNLVDLDNLRVTWEASGDAEDIKICVENIDSGEQTQFYRVRSTDGELTLAADEYHKILRNRTLMQSNRVRIIAQTNKHSFYSRNYDIDVGATITGVVFDERVKVGALVDNILVDGYKFEVIMTVPKKDEVDYLTLSGEVSGARDFHYDNNDAYDWGATKIIYLGPDDPGLFRTAIFYDATE